MTKSQQFWTLLKFLASIDPLLWMLSLSIGLPLLFNGAMSDPRLFSLLSSPIPVGVGILGVWALVPEMWPGARGTMGAGSEFLLTRAVERPAIYRARAVLFYAAVFLVPLASLAISLREPELRVLVMAKSAVQKCLVSVPGSMRVPAPAGNLGSLITMPQGNLLVNSWRLWIFAVTACGVQVLLVLLYPLKHRGCIFGAIFLACVLALPCAEFVFPLTDRASYTVMFFCSFVAHQTAFWIATAFVLVLGQLWCEQRFGRLEHSN